MRAVSKASVRTPCAARSARDAACMIRHAGCSMRHQVRHIIILTSFASPAASLVASADLLAWLSAASAGSLTACRARGWERARAFWCPPDYTPCCVFRLLRWNSGSKGHEKGGPPLCFSSKPCIVPATPCKGRGISVAGANSRVEKCLPAHTRWRLGPCSDRDAPPLQGLQEAEGHRAG